VNGARGAFFTREIEFGKEKRRLRRAGGGVWQKSNATRYFFFLPAFLVAFLAAVFFAMQIL
jgi:hypothetical protein